MAQQRSLHVFAADGSCGYLAVPVATARFDSDFTAPVFAAEWCLFDMALKNMLRVSICEVNGLHTIEAEIYDSEFKSLWEHPPIPFQPTGPNLAYGPGGGVPGIPDHKWGLSQADTIGLYMGPDFTTLWQQLSFPWYVIKPVVDGVLKPAIIAFGANINAPMSLFRGASDISLQFTGMENEDGTPGAATFDERLSIYCQGVGQTPGVAGRVPVGAKYYSSACMVNQTKDTSNALSTILSGIGSFEVESRITAAAPPPPPRP